MEFLDRVFIDSDWVFDLENELVSFSLEWFISLEPFLGILTIDLPGEIVASLRELQGLVRHGVAYILV